MKKHIADNRVKYICGMILFAVGAVWGSIAMSKLPPDDVSSLTSFFSSSAEQGRGAAFISVYKHCLLDNLKTIFIFFILSLTLYTCWLCFVIPLLKGFTSGFTAAFLVKNYGVHGLVYALLGIMPSSAIQVFVRVFSTVVCINFAGDRMRRRDLGARAAFGIMPSLAVVYCVMAIFSLYDALVAPALFKTLF